MSLNINITNVRDYEELLEPTESGGQRLNGTAQMVAFAMMLTDMGSIDAGNVREFAWRLRLVDATSGPLAIPPDALTGVEKTEELAVRFIGARANVETLSTAKFLAHLRRLHENHERDRAWREKRATKTERAEQTQGDGR
jgi:hypothetical protein